MRRAFPASALLLALLAAAPPAAGIGAPVLTVRALSGQAYEGTLVDSGDCHAFLLEDFAPQALSVAVKASKGSSLVPDLLLLDPADQDVTSALAPFRKDGARNVVVKNATTVTLPGAYTLLVAGKGGSTGGYVLKARARVVRTFKGSGFIPTAGGNDEFTFLAPTEATVSLKVVPGTGSVLAARYALVTGSACGDPRLVPGTKPGTASFAVPFTSDHAIRIEGDGGTAGAFNWKAKVKAARPSRKAVRVNGGAVHFPGPGPAPAKSVTGTGQSVVGFDADASALCWREVRTTGGGGNIGKNSISCSTLTGKGRPGLAKDFAVDVAPPARTFALGPNRAVAFADGGLHAAPRDGGMEDVLDPSLAAPLRVLADESAAYVLDPAAGVLAYPFAGGGPLARSTESGAFLDMAFGATGIVYAFENGGGDLEVRTVDRAGTSDTSLGTLGPNPGFRALASRGPDVFVAVDDGSGGSEVHAFSACDPGNPRLQAAFAGAPVRAMCADELNLYLLEADPLDGVRLRQVARGGGEATVIARGAPGFAYESDDLAAVRGFVYLLVDDGGKPAFYRVKRR